jgi:hypothetical protein
MLRSRVRLLPPLAKHLYALGVSLADGPLQGLLAKTQDLPGTTEVERLAVRRIGQDAVRDGLLVRGRQHEREPFPADAALEGAAKDRVPELGIGRAPRRRCGRTVRSGLGCLPDPTQERSTFSARDVAGTAWCGAQSADLPHSLQPFQWCPVQRRGDRVGA